MTDLEREWLRHYIASRDIKEIARDLVVNPQCAECAQYLLDTIGDHLNGKTEEIDPAILFLVIPLRRKKMLELVLDEVQHDKAVEYDHINRGAYCFQFFVKLADRYNLPEKGSLRCLRCNYTYVEHGSPRQIFSIPPENEAAFDQYCLQLDQVLLVAMSFLNGDDHD